VRDKNSGRVRFLIQEFLFPSEGTGERDVDGRLFEFSTSARGQRCHRILALIIHPPMTSAFNNVRYMRYIGIILDRPSERYRTNEIKTVEICYPGHSYTVIVHVLDT